MRLSLYGTEYGYTIAVLDPCQYSRIPYTVRCEALGGASTRDQGGMVGPCVFPHRLAICRFARESRTGAVSLSARCSPSQFLDLKRYEPWKIEDMPVVDVVIISLNRASRPVCLPLLSLAMLFKCTRPLHIFAMLGIPKDRAHTLDSSDARRVEIP